MLGSLFALHPQAVKGGVPQWDAIVVGSAYSGLHRVSLQRPSLHCLVTQAEIIPGEGVLVRSDRLVGACAARAAYERTNAGTPTSVADPFRGRQCSDTGPGIRP
jgi:hypothetical protein